MKYTQKYRDDDNIGIWVITGLLIIAVVAMSFFEKNFSFLLILWFLYVIYFVIQNEIQDNHNK